MSINPAMYFPFQRIGILFGRYEKHENVPLGIRATVATIYEPPQVNFFFSLILAWMRFWLK